MPVCGTKFEKTKNGPSSRRGKPDLSKPIQPEKPAVAQAQAQATAAQALALLKEKTEDGTTPALEAAIARGLFASLLTAAGQAEEQPPWQSWVRFADGAPGGGKDGPQPRVQLIAALLLHDTGAAGGDALASGVVKDTASERGALLKSMDFAQLQHAILESAQLQHALIHAAPHPRLK